MAKEELRIASNLRLPLRMVGEATAILAKRGAGKSNTAKVVVEEVLDTGLVQVIVLDPVGHWWSLRADKDGKPKGGYDVAVFGGPHGDLPLEPLAGRLLAQTAVESGQSVVLDVSGLDSNGAMQRFAYEFAEELYRLKQAKPSPLLLVLEEADEFAPQTTSGPNVARMVGSFARLMKRGRGRGIGMLVISQRSAALSKNVLDQADTLIVMRTVGPRDRAAIEGWIKHQSAAGADEVLPSLPGLKTGEAWVWNPENDVLRRVMVRKARTFDSTQSSRPGEVAVTAEVKPIDVEALGEAIAATVERAKQNDPAELRAEVARLRSELEKHEAFGPDIVEKVVEVEKVVTERVPVWGKEQEAILDRIADELESVTTAFQGLLDELGPVRELALRTAAEPVRSRTEGPPRVVVPPVLPPPRPIAATEPRPTMARPPAAVIAASNGDGSALSGPQQKILDTLAWWSSIGVDQPEVGQVAFVVGNHARSKGFTNNLSALSSAGLIVRTPGRVELTDAGRSVAVAPPSMPSEAELQEAIYAQAGKGNSKRAEMLRILVDARGDVSMDDLAERMGYHPRSKGFTNNVSSLSGLGLVERRPGFVRASRLCYLDAPAHV